MTPETTVGLILLIVINLYFGYRGYKLIKDHPEIFDHLHEEDKFKVHIFGFLYPLVKWAVRQSKPQSGV
ncbi:TPA: hypothetical protein DF272_03505 [Candidatus Falkowbacteria bacterium]|nr:hypothetical protein [Candidatus Falkowbacteria bacterium]